MRNRSPCGSPNLRKVAFVLPSFVHHQTDCQCHLCNTLTLQTLVLCAVYIQVSYNECQRFLYTVFFIFDLKAYHLAARNTVCNKTGGKRVLRVPSRYKNNYCSHHFYGPPSATCAHMALFPSCSEYGGNRCL